MAESPMRFVILVTAGRNKPANYVNLISKGIIDPTKVIRAAIQNAASVAALLITIEAMVAEVPKKNAAVVCPQGGGGMAVWTSKSRCPTFIDKKGSASRRAFCIATIRRRSFQPAC
jgi:hypothetical protein